MQMVKEEITIALLNRDIAFDLLRRLKVPYSVRLHSLRVTEKALEIADSITKAKVDKNLIEVGAILHDIGRSKTHGFQHTLIGGRILRERGFPDEVARICETHILGGLDSEDAKSVGLPEENFIPNTIEEKIVCLADKLIAGRREVSIKERLEIWFGKYGQTKILQKAKQRIETIQKEIEDLM